MHDFKLTDYDQFFFTGNLGFTIAAIIINIILLFIILTALTVCIIKAFKIDISEYNAAKLVIIIAICAIPLSFLMTHLECKNEKHNLEYEAKAKVIDYKHYSDKDQIVDDRSSKFDDYIIVQMKDKKQKFYIDENVKNDSIISHYKTKIDDHFKAGDTVKIKVYLENEPQPKLVPHIGEVGYLNAMKNKDVNTNYLEFKKID